MTFLGLSGLINFIFSVFLAFMVILRGPKNIRNISYAAINFSIALYSAGYFFWQASTDITTATFWFKILTTGIILINITFLYFVFAFVEIFQKRKTLLFLLSVINAIFIYLNYSSKLYIGLEPRYNLGLWPIPTYIFNIYLAFWSWQCLYGLYWLLKGIGMHTGRLRQQIQYITAGAVIGFWGGATNWPMWYSIKLPPYFNILISIYISIVAYAIIRHQLLDIKVIVRKTLVFAGMFAFVFGVVVAVAMLVAQLLGGANTLLSLAISALIITFTLRPLETLLVNATDKFLFQKRYEYKQILRAFIDDVVTELNLDEVVNSTLKLLDQTLHPYAAAVFILNKVDDKYQLYDSHGIEDKNMVFTSESKLVTFLKGTHNPAVIRQINGIAGVNPGIQQEMAALKAVIVLPLLLHDDLIGFISLGRKKSDDEYTKDDLDVLLDLARTETIAVANAQLLTEAAQSERRAAIGTMAAGIHHEIGNPLNIMSTRIQLFKLSRERGLFQNKSNEEILNDAGTTLDECLKQSERISDITKKLSNFAKPSKEFKPELVNISQEIDETLAIVGHDLELGKITIHKSIASDLPPVRADRREIQQIFFNIIRNAAQAIEEAGTISITAAPATDSKVHIEIEDTGKGIPEDKAHRIFEPFFTTKAPNRGTGLGLSIVRQLVWRNKGEISFKSRAGAGTTFILEFPKGE